jgi:hypothetical protein
MLFVIEAAADVDAAASSVAAPSMNLILVSDAVSTTAGCSPCERCIRFRSPAIAPCEPVALCESIALCDSRSTALVRR